MSPSESECLDRFPAWLATLADDARALAAVLETCASEEVRRSAAVALTYIVKSVDLITDGLEQLGYLDDALVARVAASSVSEPERAAETSGTIERLAQESELIRSFLGDEYARLEMFVEGLAELSVRGRSVLAVLEDPEIRRELLVDVRAWAQSFVPPSFARDPKNLLKLRSFLATKLP